MIYFVRHGESEANRDKVFAGKRADVELTDTGRSQAKQAGKEIRENNIVIDHVVCSPLKRTRETAKILVQEIGFSIEDIVYDDRIAEYDLGITTGKPVREITAEEIVSAEEAESPHHFLERIKQAFDEYSKIEGNTLVVSHGGVSRMLKCFKEGGDVNLFYNTSNYKNADIIEIEWQ